MHVHKCKQTHACTHTHTCIHTHICTLIHTCMHVHKCKQTHTCMHIHAHTCTRTCACMTLTFFGHAHGKALLEATVLTPVSRHLVDMALLVLVTCVLHVLLNAPAKETLYTNKRRKKREREMFYLTTHSTHFIYGYMASDIWLKTILIVRKITCYSYRLTARVLLYAPSHRQDNTYPTLCYTSRGALAGTRNSSMGPPHEGSIRWPITPLANALPLSYVPLPRRKKSFI